MLLRNVALSCIASLFLYAFCIDRSHAAEGLENPAKIHLKILKSYDSRGYLHRAQDSTGKIRFFGAVGLFSKEGSAVPILDSKSKAGFTPRYSARINVKGSAQLSWYLDTLKGRRQLSYSTLDIGGAATPTIFHYKVSPRENNLLTLDRNLAADLERREPGNKITKVYYGLILGDGEIELLNLAGSANLAKKSNPVESFSTKLPANESASPGGIAGDIDGAESEPVVAAARPGGTRRSIRLPYKRKPPGLKIDGRIDEAVWKSTPVADKFLTSDESSPHGRSTLVNIFSDKRNLYVAFRCHDDQPDLVTAIKTLNDRGLGIDDSVTVTIDTYQDFSTASSFSVNALGTRNVSGKSVVSQRGKKAWSGAAVKTDYGWSAELAIPLELLNFQSGVDSFGVNFSRYHHRSAEHSYWVKASTEKKKQSNGLLTGLKLPNATKEKMWTFMPYLVAGKNKTDRDGNFNENAFHGGAILRFEPTNNLTSIFELYPDFSQVENQISDIDFSYNEKEIEDTRPFFLEGSTYYENDSEYFYSPRIPEFIKGAKAFMQDGKNVAGALVAESDDGRIDLHAKYQRRFSSDSGFGFSGTSFHQGEQSSRLVSGTVNQRFSSGVAYEIKGAVVNNEDGGLQTDGESAKVTLSFGRDLWETGIKSTFYDVGFQPMSGLLNADLPGTRSVELYGSLYREESGPLKQMNTDVSVLRRQTESGEDQNNGVYLGTDFVVFDNTRLQLAYNRYQYRPVDMAPGIFQTTTFDDNYWSANADFNIYETRFGYGAFLADGDIGGGEYQYLSGYVWYSPTSNINFKLSAEDLTSFGRYKQTTLSSGWNFSAKDGLVARYSRGDDYQQSRIAYRRIGNSGVDIYLTAEKVTDQKGTVTGKLLWKL